MCQAYLYATPGANNSRHSARGPFFWPDMPSPGGEDGYAHL
jgi:hypothetical protein